jgi:hypothetical protein
MTSPDPEATLPSASPLDEFVCARLLRLARIAARVLDEELWSQGLQSEDVLLALLLRWPEPPPLPSALARALGVPVSTVVRGLRRLERVSAVELQRGGYGDPRATRILRPRLGARILALGVPLSCWRGR